MTERTPFVHPAPGPKMLVDSLSSTAAVAARLDLRRPKRQPESCHALRGDFAMPESRNWLLDLMHVQSHLQHQCGQDAQECHMETYCKQN